MSTWWLSDGSTTYTLDTAVSSIKTDLPGRRFKMIELAGNGAQITGNGKYRSRVLTVTKKFIASQEANRLAFLGWMTRSIGTALTLYRVVNGANCSMTVYAMPDGGEDYQKLYVSGDVSFKLLAPSPFFVDPTGKTVVTSVADTSLQSITCTLTGVDSVPTISFTPSGTCSFFQVKTFEGYGVTIQSSFTSALVISMANGLLTATQGGVAVGNIFSADSRPFSLVGTGAQTVYAIASAGSLTIGWNERYL